LVKNAEKKFVLSAVTSVKEGPGSVPFASPDFLLKLLETDPTLISFSHIILCMSFDCDSLFLKK